MTDPTLSPVRHRRGLLVAVVAGAVLLVLAGVGVYGLLAGPTPHPINSPMVIASSQPTGQKSTPAPGPSAPPQLPITADGEQFARAVAAALFTWDTFTTLTPADVRAVLLAAADPSGIETPGLIDDLDHYLPSATTWRDLAAYRTRQWLSIQQVAVPDQWPQAVAAGHLRDGLIAYTIAGTRHRAGVWFDRPVTSEHPVAFTVFLSCPPASEHCALLRLSQLNNPLP